MTPGTLFTCGIRRLWPENTAQQGRLSEGFSGEPIGTRWGNRNGTSSADAVWRSLRQRLGNYFLPSLPLVRTTLFRVITTSSKSFRRNVLATRVVVAHPKIIDSGSWLHHLSPAESSSSWHPVTAQPSLGESGCSGAPEFGRGRLNLHHPWLVPIASFFESKRSTSYPS